jgi:hypothetical protein
MNLLSKAKEIFKPEKKGEDFKSLRSFVLIVGNSRSGSTVLGSVIDAHPHAIIANETWSSANFWRGADRQSILEEICKNSENNYSTGRMSEGYSYSIEQEKSGPDDVLVMGDKIWNPTTLMLHGNYPLLARLQNTLGCPVQIIHAIRNPFDVIATMHTRSSAPVRDRILWYFMHCDAVCAIRDSHEDCRVLDVHHEDLILSSPDTIARLCDFLALEQSEAHRNACKKLLFSTPKTTRSSIEWAGDDIDMVLQKMEQYNFLSKYISENYDSLRSS